MDRTAIVQRVGTAHQKPAFLGNVFLRDRNEDGRARFGGEQVVAGGVSLARLNVQAYREQVAVFVQEDGEIHLFDELSSLFCRSGQILYQLGDVDLSLGQQVKERPILRLGR